MKYQTRFVTETGELTVDLDRALYALNGAITRAADLGMPEMVETLEELRDRVWDQIRLVNPSRKD